MRISDWSSDVCSSDLAALLMPVAANAQAYKCDLPTALARPKPDLPSKDQPRRLRAIGGYTLAIKWAPQFCHDRAKQASAKFQCGSGNRFGFTLHGLWRSEEHTSELQSLMRISYAVFCLKTKTKNKINTDIT